MSAPVSVALELVAATKLRRGPNESADNFCRRLARTVNQIPNDEWMVLSEGAQVWVQQACKAIDNGLIPPLPQGMTPLFGIRRDNPMGDRVRGMLIKEPELSTSEIIKRLRDALGDGFEIPVTVIDEIRKQFLFALTFLESKGILNRSGRPAANLRLVE